MSVRYLFVALAVVLAVLTAPARAHLLPRQNATLHVVGDKGYLVIAVPASAMSGVDDNGDGLISPSEIDHHRSAIADRVRRGFAVRTGHGRLPFAFLWIADPDGGLDAVPGSGGSPYVVALAGVTIAKNSPVTVSTDLFGTGANERELTLRAHRGDDVEIAQLTPLRPSDTVFRNSAGLFASMVETGMAHILSGPDHLLFLLTLLIAGVTLQRLAVQVTAFTVAHSVTLALTLFGLVHADPAWVEPGIALSIVAVALLNLIGRGHGLRMRTGVVFACGLLHGLGFASALNGIVGESGNRLLMLVGFNLGIEAGQAVFLGLLVTTGWGLHRMLRNGGLHMPRLGPSLASATAMVLGLLMVAGRTVPAMQNLGL